MAAQPDNPELHRIVDYIMNRAAPGELEVLRAALDRRQGSAVEARGPGDMDFSEMARRTISGHGGLQGHMQMPDVKSMTRRLVTGMLKAEAPDIGDKELEILLDRWVPDPAKKSAGREQELPRDVFFNMARQFLHYSDGRMTDRELRQLKEAMHDWPKRYWEMFSDRTRELLAYCIEGKITEDDFWKRLQAG